MKVTNNQISKQYVRNRYLAVDAADPADVPAPFSCLDFHDGKAELRIGGISYEPGVTTIVKFHGTEFFSVSPSIGEDGAGISATFLDDAGKETLRIVDNVWEGAVGAWDTEVIGARIMVRKKKGTFALVLRLEPPGTVVIEKLDMRIGDAHILASEQSYAIGRYVAPDLVHWFHVTIGHLGAPLRGAAAIEFLTPSEVEWRDQRWIGQGQRMADADNAVVMQSGLGVTYKPLGIIVGANCLKFAIGSYAIGPRLVKAMRRVVFDKPDRVAEFIGMGVL